MATTTREYNEASARIRATCARLETLERSDETSPEMEAEQIALQARLEADRLIVNAYRAQRPPRALL